MRPPDAERRPGGGGAAQTLGKIDAADDSTRYRRPQLFDDLGHRLPARRWAIEGAPARAVPGWYRLAADRWVEGGR